MSPTDYWKLDLDAVIMILENYRELSTGANPENPAGYDNPETGRVGGSVRAPFENSCMLAAEVARRVRRCGIDGFIVEERYGLVGWSYPKEPETISQERGIVLNDIYRKINRVAYYCCGRRCRKETYIEFISHRKKPAFAEKINV